MGIKYLVWSFIPKCENDFRIFRVILRIFRFRTIALSWIFLLPKFTPFWIVFPILSIFGGELIQANGISQKASLEESQNRAYPCETILTASRLKLNFSATLFSHQGNKLQELDHIKRNDPKNPILLLLLDNFLTASNVNTIFSSFYRVIIIWYLDRWTDGVQKFEE